MNRGCVLDFNIKTEIQSAFRLLNHNGQSHYLVSCIEKLNVGRRIQRADEDSANYDNHSPIDLSFRKICTFKYTVKVNGEVYPVCQRTLCDILGVTPRRIQVIQIKLKSGSGVDDGRGQHMNRPHANKPDLSVLVCNHINSFPKYENHYSRDRGDPLREYLNPDINIRIMHRLFIETHPTSNVKYWFYRDIFNTKFKLRFGQPRSDTCRTCDQFQMQLQNAQTEALKQTIMNKSELHHRKAEKGYVVLKNDGEAARNNPNLHVICGDLQQVLFTPQLTHGNIFYQRQFSCYNYGIHEMSTGDGTMCLWNESIARRGSLEIASCLLKYIKGKFSRLEINQERKLILWSDRCIGQNNNWTLVCLWLYLIQNKFFTVIEQKFLTTGHSFMPCDREFALIEQRKRVSKVMVPDQWNQVIKESRPNNPFHIQNMDRIDFKNFTDVENAMQRPTKMKITGAIWLQLSADDPTTIRARTSHNELESWTSYSLLPPLRGGRGRLANVRRNFMQLGSLELTPMYSNPLPIKAAKLKDLNDMCEFMLDEHAAFYKALLSEVE